MPQMSPMWWMTLMIMFNLMLTITNTMMYFEKGNKKNKKEMGLMKKKELN